MMTRNVLIYLTLLAEIFCTMLTATARDSQHLSDIDPAELFTVTPSAGDSLNTSSFRGVRVTVSRTCRYPLAIDSENCLDIHRKAILTDGTDTVALTPRLSDDRRDCVLLAERPLTDGDWTLIIPQGYFYVDLPADYSHVSPGDEESLKTLAVPGAWRSEGTRLTAGAAFSIHDDDTIDGTIPSSGPSDWMLGGYFSTLYPLLESLGLRGCLSLEGWRCGFTSDPPELNENGIAVKRLQDEKGWEIQSHSMTARYSSNNWLVNGLDSELAQKILSESSYAGIRSNMTTSVFDTETWRQYTVSSDHKRWTETPVPWIKSYICDYATGKVIAYNPVFPVDYQWGEWFRIADGLGIHGKAWVTPGPTSSHSNVPLINEICPYGFESDGVTFYNLPPLRSTATRLMMEGQAAGGYVGEQDSDNTYNPAHFDFYKLQIDEACDKGAWIVLGLHAYRPCWKNSLPGALVSEGGDYPDAWVNPMEGVDPVTGDLTPPASLGISDWSQWHPCPGTRLYMLWELLRYARDKEMKNLTSSEAFGIFGNTFATGYHNDGIKIGPDTGSGIYGTRERYPHYVIGADGSEDYYNPITSPEINASIHLSDKYISDDPLGSGYDKTHRLRGYSPDGLEIRTDRSTSLPKGIWIINGQKIIIN